MEQIKLSVIVPIYNLEKYIENTVNSICNQTYKNLEIIIVNDGSNYWRTCKKGFKDSSY